MADIRKITNANGTDSFRVRYKDKSKKSGYASKTFKTLKLAKIFKAQKDLDEQNGITDLKPLPTLSVDEAIDRWLKACSETGRDGREPVELSTFEEYKRRANVMRAYNWPVTLASLTHLDIKDFRTWLLREKSRDLARRTLSSFRSVMIEMQDQGYLAFDPSANISIKSGGRNEEHDNEIEIPSDQEVCDLLGAADIMGKRSGFYEMVWRRYRPMIYMLPVSGLRMSELRGAPWESLSSYGFKVVQRADKYGVVGPVKSKSAKRFIELSSQITDIVYEWQEYCADTRHNLIFPTNSGRPILQTNFTQDVWTPLFEEADLMTENTKRGVTRLRPKYTPHALRHFYASTLIEKNKDWEYIRTRMGHSKIETTINIYGHLKKDRQKEHQQTADEFADLFKLVQMRSYIDAI
jgi:site-specific recombinase XerD